MKFNHDGEQRDAERWDHFPTVNDTALKYNAQSSCSTVFVARFGLRAE